MNGKPRAQGFRTAAQTVPCREPELRDVPCVVEIRLDSRDPERRVLAVEKKLGPVSSLVRTDHSVTV
jgi:hypothetical protein